SHHLEYGGKGIDTPFLIASITKLFTTSCIFILKDQGRLSLDDPLVKYIDKEKLQYLHIYRGQEFSEQLTIAHLLCHTSGLPDAIEEGSHRAKKRAIKQDIYTDFEETLKNTRNLKPRFEPETKNKAHYANINFDIVGKIIEVITNSTLEDVYQRFIFDPLDLKHTYLPVHEHDNVPKFYYKDVSYYRPKIIKSIRASGGV